jgi:hypothetical protein
MVQIWWDEQSVGSRRRNESSGKPIASDSMIKKHAHLEPAQGHNNQILNARTTASPNI